MSSTSPQSEKTCPECAEVVKAAARVCRFCGHRWGDVQVGVGAVAAVAREMTPEQGAARRRTALSETGVVALLAGILSVFVSVVGMFVDGSELWPVLAVHMGVVGAILCVVALLEIRRANGELVGRGVAIAGSVVGALGSGMSLLILADVITINLSRVREVVDGESASHLPDVEVRTCSDVPIEVLPSPCRRMFTIISACGPRLASQAVADETCSNGYKEVKEAERFASGAIAWRCKDILAQLPGELATSCPEVKALDDESESLRRRLSIVRMSRYDQFCAEQGAGWAFEYAGGTMAEIQDVVDEDGCAELVDGLSSSQRGRRIYCCGR